MSCQSLIPIKQANYSSGETMSDRKRTTLAGSVFSRSFVIERFVRIGRKPYEERIWRELRVCSYPGSWRRCHS